jgi:membrane protein YdbS with pleckstrin-like domain
MLERTEPARFYKIDPRMRWVWFFQYAFFLLLPAAIAAVPIGVYRLELLAKFAALVLLMTALFFYYTKRAYQHFAYALADDGIWLQHGVWWRALRFIPRARVQHTDVIHGPIDRKLGMAQLVVTTAGIHFQKMSIPGLTEAHAHALRDELLKRRDEPMPLATL